MWGINCSSEFKPIIYRRYVDDTIFRNRQQVDKVMSDINFCHKNATFTAELGTDNKLPFLDTLVTFNSTSLSTDVFSNTNLWDCTMM